MFMTASLPAITALLHHALAAPNAPQFERRVIATSFCNQDNLYRSLVDPRTSASASSFCSTYIRSTVTSATTTNVTATSSPAEKRDMEEKRNLAATTYPPARLSSACSCILTAHPTPSTVYTTTSTVTEPPTGCTKSATIVQNGDFEAELTPWTVSNIDPPLPEFFQYESYGVQAPGYDSANAFTVNDSIASSYFELDLDQTLTLCAGKKYNVKAQFYMTDSHEIPKQTYIEVLVDGTQIATSTFADGLGPPIVWKILSGSFTAASASPKLTFKFAATDFVGVTWGLDKVVVTPA